ncbi:uroporphyrinogen-III synthase [Chitinophaga pendula]|uniref:uroporphyrinogen-III synthase n=1 Tax=Chitinophaga TaxID=79328 RepID=UPI000BAFE17F|nr:MULTISPECIES: uroporphyrinogen-III synthase [Chitinophaga]ASZ14293.1 hypothetical protein CK934_26775 [Chitinophaga sp. MD30]UCJ08059.1 uroporphyrinogen-III synthase [Chitinophaga pendula]
MPDDHRILCTRPLPASLIRQAATHGVHIEVHAFIRIQSVITPAAAAVISKLASQPATVIFTSSNAVTAVSELLQTQSDRGTQWQLYCLQGATLDTVWQYFDGQQVIATTAYSKELAYQLLNDKPEGPLLFFCGDQRRDELPDTLAAGGLALQEYQVYQTVATPVALPTAYQGVLFFSPSAVTSYFSMNALPPSAVCFAIGHTTAGALLPYTSADRIIVCKRPGTNEMIQTVIEYFDHNNNY